MEALVVRVWIPDRPGALGQVASRIGAVRGDVVGIEILERGAGRAIDELLVMLPDAELIELLIAEIGAVDGVSVEHVRRVTGSPIDPSLEALAVAAELAEAAPAERLRRLLDGVLRAADAEWAAAVRDQTIGASVGDVPGGDWIVAFLEGSRHLAPGDAAPDDVIWIHLSRSGLSVAAGRDQRRFHDRERRRIELIGRIADALIDA